MSDTPVIPEEPIQKARHPFVEAWEMFRRNHAAVVALAVLVLIILGAIFGPILYATDPFEMVWAPFSPPGVDGYLLGTDYLGRDMMAMVLNGARVSLLIGLAAAVVSVVIGVTVGALAGVNCFGSVFMPGTEAYWAWPHEIGGEFGGERPPENYAADAEDWGAAKANPAMGQNTTIACIATDVILTASEAKRVAQMALSGFSRAIRPVFAPFDGDAVFVMSSGRIASPEQRALLVARIGELAASTLARAIARGVFEAKS